jgi:dihydrofolate reductase
MTKVVVALSMSLDGYIAGPDDGDEFPLDRGGEPLLDEIQVSVVPLLLGRGVRLFDHIDEPVTLAVGRVVDAPGVTHLRYRVRSRP